jgi:hypothetical protein
MAERAHRDLVPKRRVTVHGARRALRLHGMANPWRNAHDEWDTLAMIRPAAAMVALAVLAGCGTAARPPASPSALVMNDVAVRLRNASLALRPGESMNMIAQRAAVFCVAHFQGLSDEKAVERAFNEQGGKMTTGPHRGVVSEFITAATTVMCPLIEKHLKQPA